jgi:hypothetical protein
MRYRVGFMGVGAALLLCSGAWYLRPMVAAHRIGISWRATMRRSHCTVGTVDEYCTTGWFPDRASSMMTTINLDPRTRALLRADRTWRLDDLVTWARLLDSTRHAFVERGWASLPCDTEVTHFPIAEAWRAGTQEVQLYAAPTIKEYGIGPRAFLSVHLVPFGGGSCGPRYGTRLLTPDEMAQRVREWMGGRLGFW